jgi:hypothetical protein
LETGDKPRKAVAQTATNGYPFVAVSKLPYAVLRQLPNCRTLDPASLEIGDNPRKADTGDERTRNINSDSFKYHEPIYIHLPPVFSLQPIHALPVQTAQDANLLPKASPGKIANGPIGFISLLKKK